MKIVYFIIFLIIAIRGFITKDKMFPNHPFLGWLVCMILIIVSSYGVYYFGEQADKIADYNMGVDAARNSKY